MLTAGHIDRVSRNEGVGKTPALGEFGRGTARLVLDEMEAAFVPIPFAAIELAAKHDRGVLDLVYVDCAELPDLGAAILIHRRLTGGRDP